MLISNKTVSKLLIGEFKTFDELREFDKEIFSDRTIEILIKEDDKNPIQIKTIVESIFLDK